MTRIGFAYNQKPETTVGAVPVSAMTSDSRPDEEPPSSSDVYAEWDSAETIAAVASALSAFGDVIPLEATEEFPEQLRSERPDIVFNIAEGLRGVNREAHVPAICEFFDVPYSGSDPFTLSLCLHKARTKELLTARGIPNAPFTLIDSEAALDRLARQSNDYPLFLKPVQEGSSKGITERNFVRTRDELESQARFLLDTYNQPVIAEAFLPGAEFTSCSALIACSAAATGRGSTFASTRRAFPTLSRSIPSPAFFQIQKTTPVCQRRHAPLVCRTRN